MDQVVFDHDVILRNLAVSIFGSLDEGRIDITGAPSIDITSTGLQSLGDAFLAAGDPFSVVYVAGNGFSFDDFTVDLIPEPGVAALLAMGFGGLIAYRRRLA